MCREGGRGWRIAAWRVRGTWFSACTPTVFHHPSVCNFRSDHPCFFASRFLLCLFLLLLFFTFFLVG